MIIIFIEYPLKTAAAAAKLLQLCLTLCYPIDGSPPGSPLPGIPQGRTLEWAAISFSNAWKWKWKWSHSVMSNSYRPHGLQPTRLLHPWDLPGSSIHGIFQARVLEWGAITFSAETKKWHIRFGSWSIINGGTKNSQVVNLENKCDNLKQRGRKYRRTNLGLNIEKISPKANFLVRLESFLNLSPLNYLIQHAPE